MTVYTYTLSSGYVLVVDAQATFGDIIIATGLLILLTLLALEIARNFYVYEHNQPNRPTD